MNVVSRKRKTSFLILIGFIVNVYNHCNCCPILTDALAAGGGFGRGFGGRGAKNNTNGKKNKRSSLDEIKETTTKKNDDPVTKHPLDKWGLPIATIDDIFPPLPPDTELTPLDPTKETYSLPEIEECLQGHLNLNLSRYFNEDGNAKISNEDGTIMTLRLLHQSPPVLAIDNFLTLTECKEIQSITTKAHQVDSATFQGSLSTRTSTSWFCHYSDIPKLLAKAHHLLNVPLETMEEPQIVRYQKGQEFSWHYDEVPPSQLGNGGQRLATLLVYLNTVPDSKGGGTTFRDLKQTIPSKNDGRLEGSSSELVMQPRQGSALLFFPAFSDGRPDDRTLHKSQVMEWDDAKWIVQMWIHQSKYKAVLPVGNSNESAREIMKETSKRLGYTQSE